MFNIGIAHLVMEICQFLDEVTCELGKPATSRWVAIGHGPYVAHFRKK